MSIYDQLQPPPEGDLPAFWKPTTPGEFVTGTVVGVRIVGHTEYSDAPCIDIQTGFDPEGKPVIVPVLASQQSLYRQVYNTRPEVGGQIRIAFLGMSGRAKVFQLDYQAPTAGAQAPAAPAAPAPAPQPAPGFGQAAPTEPAAAATPWASQPQAPAPAPAPWG